MSKTMFIELPMIFNNEQDEYSSALEDIGLGYELSGNYTDMCLVNIDSISLINSALNKKQSTVLLPDGRWGVDLSYEEIKKRITEAMRVKNV